MNEHLLVNLNHTHTQCDNSFTGKVVYGAKDAAAIMVSISMSIRPG
jgi:hypothetical protein